MSFSILFAILPWGLRKLFGGTLTAIFWVLVFSVGVEGYGHLTGWNPTASTAKKYLMASYKGVYDYSPLKDIGSSLFAEVGKGEMEKEETQATKKIIDGKDQKEPRNPFFQRFYNFVGARTRNLIYFVIVCYFLLWGSAIAYKKTENPLIKNIFSSIWDHFYKK